MRLSAEGLKDRAKWEEAGYALLDPFRCGKYFPCISGKCGTEPVE